ncbi:MAG: DUF4426 domain-containing protein [Gammaproteobacteria bacterium]
MRARNSLMFTFLSLILFTTASMAEQSQTFGKYTIHYNVINTEILDPTVASGYKITRSKNRALLNISILKNEMGTSVKPVKATVAALVTTLNLQQSQVNVRELEDSGAIYYVGEIPIKNAETLKFEIKVQPLESDEIYTLKFQQEFFTE